MLPRSWIVVALCTAAALGAWPAAADTFCLLNCDRQAAQARFDLIDQAQCQIDVAYFAVDADVFGLAFLSALRDAAQRGVRVRVVIDGIQNQLPAVLQNYLLAEGIELREYHPAAIHRPLELNRRLHDKLLIVDGVQLITGGRNIDGRNFGLAGEPDNYLDRDVFVCGLGAQQAQAYFDGLWECPELRAVRPSVLPTIDTSWLNPGRGGDQDFGAERVRRQDPGAALTEAMRNLQATGLVSRLGGCNWLACRLEPCCARFLCDRLGRKHQSENITDVVLELLAGARHSIIIESPYMYFSPRMMTVLAEARARGVHVILLTNSLATTDQMLVYGGYANQKRRLLELGIELYEYRGRDHFHAKSALIDGAVTIIGSHNFDPRGEQLNTEVAVLAYGPEPAALLMESIGRCLASSMRIGPDGQPIGLDSQHPGATLGKRLQLIPARAVAPLIGRHL